MISIGAQRLQAARFPLKRLLRLPSRQTIATAAMMGFAAFSGMAVAVVGIYYAAFVIALILGVVSLFIPLRHLIVLLVVTAFAVMGQLIYFARIDKALWMPFLLGVLLFVRLPGELLRRDPRLDWQASFRPRQTIIVGTFLNIYFVTLLATTLINRNSPLQVFVSSKEYLFMWGLYFIIMSGCVAPALLTRIWNLLPWLLPLQLPLIFYQRFVVAARRAVLHLGAEWDAVVGAFGGDPNGGGSSGAMGIFVVIMSTYSIARWKKGQMKGSHCLIIVGSGLLAILLAEVKFAVLLLPVAIAVAFRREFLARPIAAISTLLVSGLVAATVLMAYQAQFSNDTIESASGGYFEHIFKASTDDQFINLQTGELGRVAAIRFWVDQQSGAVEALIGQGMGASRKGDLVVGEAAKRWMFNIARSSLAVLLWETGLFGTGIFMLLLISAYLSADKLANDGRTDPLEGTILQTCAAGLVILLLELPYNTDILYSPQIQILFMMMLGQIALANGRLRKTTRNQ